MAQELTKIQALNFRCYRNTNEIDLAPVNILVGENSSGKSTLLSLVRLTCDLASNKQADFNSRPFYLGSYDEIAFNIGGVSGRSNFFSLSLTILSDDELEWMGPSAPRKKSQQREIRIEFKYVNKNSQPKIEQINFDIERIGKVVIDFHRQRIEYDFPNEEKIIVPMPQATGIADSNALTSAWIAVMELPNLGKAPHENRAYKNLLRTMQNILMHFGGITAYAASPVRSQPRRTYDPVTSNTLEDSNYALQNLASLKRTKNAEWENLKKVISGIGDSSGLFKDFEIRLLGKNESDPFQAQVKIGSKKVNVVDVGFGVSQVIPAIYDLFVVRAPIILIQQPEIHLHPKAQAGLGSIIATLPERRKKQKFLIETHSEFLIDALSIAIKTGKAKSEDFRLFFCERMKNESVVHQLKFDETGQIVGQPDSYRDFFLRHQGSLFGLN